LKKGVDNNLTVGFNEDMKTINSEPIKFTTTATEHRVISKLAKRAVLLAKKHGGDYGMMDAKMDILATHLNGCPLNLKKLMLAEDFDFAHDVFGIRRHLDRETGQLKNCFFPRCARP